MLCVFALDRFADFVSDQVTQCGMLLLIEIKCFVSSLSFQTKMLSFLCIGFPSCMYVRLNV